jgi:hypothetical protein
LSGTLAGTALDGINQVGLDYGPDNLRGSPGEIVYQNGQADSVCMGAFCCRGPGNAYWPDASPTPGVQGAQATSHFVDGSDARFFAPSVGTPTLQELIDQTSAYVFQENDSITCTYTIAGQAPVSITLRLRPLFSDGFED